MMKSKEENIAMTTRKTFGQRGEQTAADYLKSRGYSIVETNWRCPHGEIDVIARQDAMMIFVEVRTRRTDSTEQPFESITPAKQKRLQKLAYAYLSAHQLKHIAWRIDLIAIAWPRSGEPIIEHVENGLDW
jgi:putative endonuclease